ncbi:MAG: flagellar assembly protein FliW [Treponema sp.]|nr:flagellar assembly protein FliW [Treponema sp.]
MKVTTKAYGPVEADERQKIRFSQGLFGFESCRDYVLLDAEKEPFYWLQSLDSVQTAFILINPFLFRPDYEVNISNEELEEIGVEEPEKALIFAIVTVPSGGSPMTANLQGPLVINRDTHAAKQVILADPRWKTRHDILAEIAAAKARQRPC